MKFFQNGGVTIYTPAGLYIVKAFIKVGQPNTLISWFYTNERARYTDDEVH